MKIIVLSCSKNTELFYPFWWCMQRFYPEHPEVIYFTDGVINPFYKTIVVKNELETWTKGFREFLNQIDDDQVLLMIDDCFIRRPVDLVRIEYASKWLKGNIACMNFEKSWDENDVETNLIGWKRRQHGSSFEVSLMCGLWQKDKLLKVVERDCSPWVIEEKQDNCGFDYYINSHDYIIDWGYQTFRPTGVVKGKWSRECKEFLDSIGMKIDYSKKGFVD